MNQHIEEYPKFKALLWSLEARGFNGHFYGILTNEELEEQIKIMTMFLNLSYWHEQ